MASGKWPKPFLLKLWALGCSLKLAIALASAATLLIMGGSLVMHYNPAIFTGMEQEIMGQWLPQAWSRAPLLVFWVPLSGLCILLFALNTLCCLIDWLTMLRVRWRKTGEYLVHAGFVLLTVAYLWGNLSGFRSGPHRLAPGDRMSIPNMPGYLLQLEEFTPQIGPGGRPLDMINKLVLWKNGRQVLQKTIRINHPLIYDGLVILPSSYGQDIQGFRFICRAPALSISQRAAACRFPPISRLWFTDSSPMPARTDKAGSWRSAVVLTTPHCSCHSSVLPGQSGRAGISCVGSYPRRW